MVEDAFWTEERSTEYQRLIDDTLYRYLKIGAGKDATATNSSRLTDVFTEEPETV